MSNLASGDDLSLTRLQRLISAIPTSFGIHKIGSTYYVESCLPTTPNTNYTNVTDALKGAIANVASGSYGIITLHGIETATLTDTITIDNRYIKINGNGWIFSTDTNDLDPMFLFKNLDIENQYNRPPYFAGLNDAVLDLNNKALVGLEVRDCCMTKHNVSFRNVKANATALEVSLETDIIGCYYNKFNVMILGQPYTAITANSIGVLLNTIGAGTYTPNYNMFTGCAKWLAYGIKIMNGSEQHFLNFDSSQNTYGYYINTVNNNLLDCYEEANTNPSIITKTGSALIYGGAWTNYPTVQSDGAVTGHLTAISPTGIKFVSAYNAGLEHRTGEVLFSQTGNVTFKMGAGDGYIYIKPEGGSDEYYFSATHFDLLNNIIKNPKNSAATALSGTQRDIEIDIGGVPYYFTVYPTKA